jgi:methionine aminotransferase
VFTEPEPVLQELALAVRLTPPTLTAEFRKIHQFVTFSIASVLQYAIADYMTEHPGWEDELPGFYAERRDRLVALLAGSRLRCTPARATYFQLVDYSAVSDLPDVEFARQLTIRHGVAAIPISVFSAKPVAAERIVRFCFAKHAATLAAAAEKLRLL